MMHFSGNDAITTLYRPLEMMYLYNNDYYNQQYTSVEIDNRYVAITNMRTKWRTMNIRIQTAEPHLILWDTSREHEGQVFTKTENAKIGRFLSKQLAEGGITLTDAQIEEYVNTVKAEVAIDTANVELVTGEAIRKAYDEGNHASGDIGDLAGSCMRYSECQPFFDIYVYNPQTVALAVIKDNGWTAGRALVWTDVDGTRWMDRIYASSKNMRVMKMWAESEGIKQGYHGGYSSEDGIVVALENGDFTYYPYMDSLYQLRKDDDQYYLSSGRAHVGQFIDNLRSTMGGPFNERSLCSYCEDNFTEDGERYCYSCMEDMSSCDRCDEMSHYDNAYHVDGSGMDVCFYCYTYHTNYCADCNQRFVDSSLNANRRCDGCVTNIEAEPEYAWAHHWPNQNLVGPCFWMRHTFDRNLGRWIPDPTTEEQDMILNSGYQWNGGQVTQNGIPVMLQGA